MHSINNVFAPLQQLCAAVVIFVLVLTALPALARDAELPSGVLDGKTQVDLCHNNNGASDYSLVQAKAEVLVNDDNNGHPNTETIHQGDIIPPFDYDFGTASGTYPGRNWNDGEDIFLNNCSDPSAPETGTVIIEKVATDGENVTFDFSGTGDIGDFSLNGGGDTGTDHADIPTGDYTITESEEDGWTLDSIVCDVEEYVENVQDGSVQIDLDKDETITCIFTNVKDDVPPTTTPSTTPETAIIHAEKIVCDAESYLPNWGAIPHSPVIDENTVSEFLATGNNAEHCKVVPWEFQWMPPTSNLNPGDNSGIADDPWTTFSSQVEIEVGSTWPHIWVREVWNDDYIPFSGESTTASTSAEIHCYKDSLHYDNFERVDDIAAGEEYHCVAWNVLKEPQPNDDEGKIIVVKKVINDDDGTATAGDFTLYVGSTTVVSGAFNHFPLGTYQISEDNEAGYEHELTYCEVYGEDDFSLSHPEHGDWKTGTSSDYNNWPNFSFDGTVELENDGDIALCLIVNDDIARPTGDGEISGGKFNDANEVGIANWTIELYQNDVLVDSATTTVDGSYSFSDLANGTYLVCEEDKSGWTQEFPVIGAPCDNGTLGYEITISSSTLISQDNDFLNSEDNGGGCTTNCGGGDTELFLIEGFVWHDIDEDGTYEPEENQEEEGTSTVETTLSGWTIEITNGSTTQSTTTDEFGNYSFLVPAGTWTISEIVMEGWSQTSPTTTTYTVTVPEVVDASFFQTIFNFFLPTAHAATTITPVGTSFNFGNVFIGGGNPTPNVTGGGGGGGRRISLSDNDDSDPVPQVLGEQVSVVPQGAPNTGAGGTSRDMLPVILLVGILAASFGIRATRNG